MSNEAILDSSGRITIPKEIRDSLALKAGDRITFSLLSDTTAIVRIKSKRVEELAGTLQNKSRKQLPITKLSR
ncbi:antitoxin PrlF [Oxalobacteraceae bacterium GrIS 2.11]